MEERYLAGTQWPSSPWDVRTVPAGGELRAKDGLEMATDGMVKLTSPGFTEPVVMHGDKMVSATVRIRCSAQPGLYIVQWNEEGKPAREWARYRVTAPPAGCHDPASSSQAGGATSWAPWPLGGGAALAAFGIGAWVWRRRRKVYR
ncbi:hypothetical protein [Streptomyces sp. NPDC058622]|uniref:hypothetical protein n=1 Tax=Streptomyces sp. NPDC058622 TaxID=3346562 RepID=UPI003647B31C